MDVQLITTALSIILTMVFTILLKYHVPQRAFTALRNATQEALTWTPPTKPQTPQILTNTEVDSLEQDVLYTPLSDLIREGENRAIVKWNEAHPNGPLYACTNPQGNKYFTLTRRSAPYEFNPTCPDCTWTTTESMTTVTRTRTNPCPVHAIRQQAIFPQPTPVTSTVTEDEIKVLEWLHQTRPNSDPEVEPEDFHTPAGPILPMVNLDDVRGEGSISGYREGWNTIAHALRGTGLLNLDTPNPHDAYRLWQERCGYRAQDADGVPGKASLKLLLRDQGGFGIEIPTKGGTVTITPNDLDEARPKPRLRFRGRP